MGETITHDYQEQPGSCFTHDGNVYSLNKLLRLSDHLLVEKLPVDDLTWVLDYDEPNPKRVAASNLDAPILVVMFEGKETVIDGLHRLAKAARQGYRSIKGKIVPYGMLHEARLKVDLDQIHYDDKSKRYFRIEKLRESVMLQDLVEAMIAELAFDDAPLTELKRPNIGSAWIVIEDPETGEILLGKRAKAANNAGQWNLFGGGIEVGETAIETALRELWEEGGIRVQASQVSELPGTPAGITIFVLPMGRADVRAKLRLNPKEVSKARWCAPDKLPANLHKSAEGLVHVMSTRQQEPEDGEWHSYRTPARSMRATMDLVGEALKAATRRPE